MENKENKRIIGWGYLLLGILLLAAGILLVVYPSESIKTFCYIIGATALIAGIALAIRIITMEKRGFKFVFSIISALCIITCAIACLVAPQAVFRVFPSLFGLFIIMDASFKFSSVIRIRRYQMKSWWAMIVVILLCICGGYLCVRFDSSVAVRTVSLTLGLTFAADGILNIMALFLMERLTRFDSSTTIKKGREVSQQLPQQTDESDSKNEIETAKPPVQEVNSNKKGFFFKKKNK